MKALFEAIEAQLKAKVAPIKHIDIYNNQLQKIDEGKHQSLPFPMVLIEFRTFDTAQLGNGLQVYDPLDVVIHLAHEFYNGERMNSNFDVLELKQQIFKALNQFCPTNASTFFRISEEQDTDYDAIYHFMLTFRTTWIDSDIDEGNMVMKEPPIELVISGAEKVFSPHYSSQYSQD